MKTTKNTSQFRQQFAKWKQQSAKNTKPSNMKQADSRQLLCKAVKEQNAYKQQSFFHDDTSPEDMVFYENLH